VLSCPSGINDDGRGALREKVFNFTHEKENGRTSSIGHEIIGFDKDGSQVSSAKFKDPLTAKKKATWPEIVAGSSRIAQLIDLCGHEKYLKTTMFGLTGLYPHYCMLVVGANMGVSRMTREHLGITQGLKIPMFIVVTKIDLAPATVYAETIATLNKILKGAFCNLKPVVVKDAKNLDKIAEIIPSRSVCPIFPVSNVSGDGIELLKKFISKLPVYDPQAIAEEDGNFIKGSSAGLEELVESEFVVDSTYNVKNVGFVVGGTVTKGEVVLNSTLMMGPDKNGTFKGVLVKEIQENRVDIASAKRGQTVTILIKSVNKNQTFKFTRGAFKKGMTLLGVNMTKAAAMQKKGGQMNPSQVLEQLCVREFDAEV
jgi:GTPase